MFQHLPEIVLAEVNRCFRNKDWAKDSGTFKMEHVLQLALGFPKDFNAAWSKMAVLQKNLFFPLFLHITAGTLTIQGYLGRIKPGRNDCQRTKNEGR